MESEIRHERSGHRGAFFWQQGDTRLAEMTYTVAGSRVIIDHTHVDDSLRGKGVSGKLVLAVFDKTPEYSDVLAE